MKAIIALLLLVATNAFAADPLPEVKNTDIEYPLPKAAYDALRKKQGVEFSRDDSGWVVAFDRSEAVVWSFAPSNEPSFPIVVKRTILEKDRHLFIKMDVQCGGSKEACDDVVRKYTAINERISREAKEKSNGSK